MITEEVIAAVARNWKRGDQVMALLFTRRDQDVVIIESVIKAVVGNLEKGI